MESCKAHDHFGCLITDKRDLVGVFHSPNWLGYPGQQVASWEGGPYAPACTSAEVQSAYSRAHQQGNTSNLRLT